MIVALADAPMIDALIAYLHIVKEKVISTSIPIVMMIMILVVDVHIVLIIPYMDGHIIILGLL